MEFVEPEVRLIARPSIDWESLFSYADAIGASAWATARSMDDEASDAEIMAEAGGKICYNSWAVGLNPNVTRVREDRGDYLWNILSSGHGSVLEHASFTFSFRNVSRVLTHELARHRAGTAISQESGRYVRKGEIPFWMPSWMDDHPVVKAQLEDYLNAAEELQRKMAQHFKLDDPGTPFHEKKEKTSFMRRFAPGGAATSLIWTANIRALRHVIELRTAPGAEEEIRKVFGHVAEIMLEECPELFGDFALEDGAWVPKWRKV